MAFRKLFKYDLYFPNPSMHSAWDRKWLSYSLVFYSNQSTIQLIKSVIWIVSHFIVIVLYNLKFWVVKMKKIE